MEPLEQPLDQARRRVGTMKNGLILTEDKLTKLAADIRTLLAHGRAKAQLAVNHELIRTYWQIGARITQERLTDNAGYGDSVLERLVDRLDTDKPTLIRCIQFHKLYPRGFPEESILTWSHIRELLTVKDPKERAHFEARAQKEGWTRDELANAIGGENYIDVTSARPGKGAKKLKRPTGGPFIYRAEVMRIIDGDTILTRLDLGFLVWKGQRIRLAAINTPRINEDGGEDAFAYVRDQLAKAKMVVVRTGKVDINGRYVGHVFYSLDEKDDWEKVFQTGRWLNQELLDRGLAKAL